MSFRLTSRLLIAVIVAVGLSACKTTTPSTAQAAFKAPGPRMASAELNALYFSGTSFTIGTHPSNDDTPYETLHDGNGNATVKFVGRDFSSNGSYHVKSDQLCFHWPELGSKAESCFWIYQVDTGTFRVFGTDYEDIGTGKII
jgi:hypothetical protein